MSIIVLPFTFTVGAVIVAAQHNSNFSTIYNDYNGNITAANIASNAAIADSQLAQITSASKVSGAALTLLTSIPSGAGLIPKANIPGMNTLFPYVKVSETQTSGTNGGSSSSGSWNTRVLNTTDTDTGSISSLSTNQVTLPSGTYLARVSSPFYQSAAVQIRLQNITDSSTLLTGQTDYSSGVDAGGVATLVGQFTLSGSKAISIQYQCGSSHSNSGLGFAGNFGTEVYTVSEFTKIG